MSVQQFHIAFSDTDIDLLRSRLTQTRWPDAASGVAWSSGTDLSYLRTLVSYWQHEYNWELHQRQLNAIPQFLTTIKNVPLHFVHIRSANPKAQSLLLIHGWPDSFYRFHKLIPLLQAHFNLIIPSIPGFGFSGRIPMAPTEIADIFAILLTEVLGYTQVFVHGGDIAVPIIEALNQHHTALLRGIHLTDVGYPTGYESDLSEKEQQFSQQTTQWMMRDGAYLLLQGTKPQTLAYALHDSPVALAAWIISMIQSQAEGTNVEQAFGGRDALLTNITLYWLTATGGSSVHYYQRMLHAAFTNPQPNVKTNVPTGIALAPRELQFPQEWAERSYAVRQFDRLAQGGHFTALEAPELIAQSLLNFAAQL